LPRATFYSFSTRLEEGTIISRPNRFVMMVRARGKVLRCHCPTTGRLGDLELRGLPCLYSTSESVKRKTRYTVEAFSASTGRGKSWIGINQTAANKYVEFFLKHSLLPKIAKGEVRREVRLGRSRIDFLVGNTLVEVKTPLITLPASPSARRARHGRFDSFDRLIRHMGELAAALEMGKEAVILMCYLYDAKPFIPPVRDGTNSRILDAAEEAERKGVLRWQVNLGIDRTGVRLIRYFPSTRY
jgi:sugar fermentation stimulation protein A